MILINSLVIILLCLFTLMKSYDNINYFIIKEMPEGSNELKFEGGSFDIQGTLTSSKGKIISKFVHFFKDQEEHDKAKALFDKFTNIRCSITEMSTVCLAYGDEYLQLLKREISEDKAYYKIHLKPNLIWEFEINHNIDIIDKKILFLTGTNQEGSLTFLVN